LEVSDYINELATALLSGANSSRSIVGASVCRVMSNESRTEIDTIFVWRDLSNIPALSSRSAWRTKQWIKTVESCSPSYQSDFLQMEQSLACIAPMFHLRNALFSY